MQVGRRVATVIADELISRGCILPPRAGGIRRERLINLIQRLAAREIASVEPSDELSPAQQVFAIMAAPMIRCRTWVSSNPKTSRRENALDEIERSLLVSAKIAEAN
jgi:hypothetical protein